MRDLPSSTLKPNVESYLCISSASMQVVSLLSLVPSTVLRTGTGRYQMSFSVALHPIAHALVQAERMPGMGANRTWCSVNPMQQQFLPFFERIRNETGKIP